MTSVPYRDYFLMTVAQCLFVIASKVITDNSSSVGSVMLSGREGNCMSGDTLAKSHSLSCIHLPAQLTEKL